MSDRTPPLSLRFLLATRKDEHGPHNAQCRDEEVADLLWRAISKTQAMMDRLPAQCESSLRGEGGDPYALPGLSGA